MGHTEEGHKESVQKSEGTMYLSYTQGMPYSTVVRSLGSRARLPGVDSQQYAY